VPAYEIGLIQRQRFEQVAEPFENRAASAGMSRAALESVASSPTSPRQFTRNFFSAAGKLEVSEAQCQYAREVAAFASPEGTLDCIDAFARTDFREDLKKTNLPTLVIHGDSDGIVPFEVSGKRTVAAIAGAKLAVIAGGPHGINASHPRQFNRALLDFLAS
jgi:non-heme chloroperoxidase